MVRIATPPTAAAAVALITLLGAASRTNADVAECNAAFARLLTVPGNLSLPLMQVSTGEFNLAYSYQNPMLAVFPPDTMGSFDMCQNAETFSAGTMDTHYCTLGGDLAGMCVPSVCSAEDFLENKMNMNILNHAIAVVQRIPQNCFLDPYLSEECSNHMNAKKYFDGIYELVTIFNARGVHCGGESVPADTMSYVMIGLTAVLGLLILAATFWSELCITFNSTLVQNTSRYSFPSLPSWLNSFELSKNFSETFHMSTRKSEFACFDAIRALSCWWVIIYHVILWQIGWIQNPQELMPGDGYLAEWWSMPFFNYSGTLCVDSFLYISAFLATYLLILTLEKQEKKGEDTQAKTWLPMYLLNRFVRITPAYMFAMFMHWKVAPLLASGPIADKVWSSNVKHCGSQWWTHLLYINTIYPWNAQRDGTCFGHTWYLADDMQFFLFVPMLVILFRSKNQNTKRLAYFFTLLIIFGCTVATAVIAHVNHWAPITWDGEEATNYSQQGFNRPYIRAPAYFVGVLAAFLWHEKKQRYPDFKLSYTQNFFTMILALSLLAAAMYGPATGSTKDTVPCILVQENCGSMWSEAEKILALSLVRPTWTIGLAILCGLCFNNQGGFVQKFMTAPIWAPFSALSYTTYLTHFTVLTFYMGQRTLRVHWEIFEFGVFFVGLTVVSTFLGLLVTLLVEKPAMKLQKLYLSQKPVMKEEKQGHKTTIVENVSPNAAVTVVEVTTSVSLPQ